MAQIIERASFADFNDNLTVLWEKVYDQFPKVARQLYVVSGTDVDAGAVSSLDSVSVAKRKREGQDFPFLSLTQNYRTNWRTYEVGGEIKITWNMRKFAKYDEINRALSGLAESTARRMEMDLTHPFTFGADGSYTNLDGDSVTLTSGDGQYLFDTDHSMPGTSTTFRNIVANNPVLSKGGLEAAEKLFATQMIDTNGQLIFYEPDTLITTNDPTTINIARQYLGSTADVESNNAGVLNPFEGRYRHIILPFLSTKASGAYDSTKANYYMLACLARTGARLLVAQEPMLIPPTENDGKEFETMDWKYATLGSFTPVFNDIRWIVFCKGDGSA
jgi:hypothetical protein